MLNRLSQSTKIAKDSFAVPEYNFVTEILKIQYSVVIIYSINLYEIFGNVLNGLPIIHEVAL